MSIEVVGVSRRYGALRALDDVSLRAPAGGLTALLGPSGGGKSTLLRIVAGLEEPDTGRVLLDGVDVTRTPPRRRGVGLVFQHYAAFTHLSVFDNVAFGLRVRRRPAAETRARVTELLELVHLDGLADRYPAQLSGGQRQRMALARALAVPPRVLLLDEPFGALDTGVRAELRQWLRRLHEQLPVTTLFVTHDREEALELADRIVVVNAGRVEQAGTPDELYDAPATPFVMGFLGPVTRLAGRLVRPHDVAVATERTAGAVEAMVTRLTRLGALTRVEAVAADGEPVSVQLPRGLAQTLELAAGDVVWLTATGPRVPVPAD